MSRYAYVTNTDSNTISVVSLATNEELYQIEVGYNPRAVITEPSGRYLFVSAEASNALSIIDRRTWQEIKRIAVGPTPKGLIVDEENNVIIVTAFDRTNITMLTGNDKMSIVSIDTLTRIGNLPTGIGACSVNIVDTEKLDCEISEKVAMNEFDKVRKLA